MEEILVVGATKKAIVGIKKASRIEKEKGVGIGEKETSYIRKVEDKEVEVIGLEEEEVRGWAKKVRIIGGIKNDIVISWIDEISLGIKKEVLK